MFSLWLHEEKSYLDPRAGKCFLEAIGSSGCGKAMSCPSIKTLMCKDLPHRTPCDKIKTRDKLLGLYIVNCPCLIFPGGRLSGSSPDTPRRSLIKDTDAV